MSKENKTVVMRVTPDEAAKLRYQRKFDKAWAKEQATLRITITLPDFCADAMRLAFSGTATKGGVQ